MAWQDTIQGGVGGALAGSAFGPVGTAIGGGLGLLGGFLGGGGESGPQSALRGQLGDLASMYGSRGRGPVERASASDFRGNQQGLVAQLEAMSRGEGPSLAEQQLRSATDRNVREQQAMAAGASGPNAALAQFQAANNTGLLGARSAQDAAAARIVEQQAAMNQLGLVLQGARGQDEDLSRFNAGQGNQMTQFQRGLNDASQLSALGLLAGQVNQGAQQPSFGEQILAGGAGMYGLAASQRAGARGGLQPIASGYPGAGGYFTPQQSYGGQPGGAQSPFAAFAGGAGGGVGQGARGVGLGVARGGLPQMGQYPTGYPFGY